MDKFAKRTTYDPRPFRASYAGSPLDWQGTIRQGSRIVWKCEHRHHNRDRSSDYNGPSAVDCAKAELQRDWL